MIAECKHYQSVAAATLIPVAVAAVAATAVAAGEGAEDPAIESPLSGSSSK